MSRIVCLDQVPSPGDPRNVSVKRLVFDWNDPAEVTRKELWGVSESEWEGCVFVNPMFKVVSREATPEFLREVRKRQSQWFRKLGRQFGAANVKRVMSVMHDPCESRLTYTGVLIIHGVDISSKQLRAFEVRAGLRSEWDL